MYDSINFALGTTFYMNLYCFMLYCFLLFVSLKGNVAGLYVQERYTVRTVLLFAGILLFSLTSFVDEDFFHYFELMSEYKGHVIDDEDVGMEVFYQYLIQFIDGDYFMFRLVVWGGSLALIVWAVRRLGISIYNTLFVILAGYIVIFSYARASLAMAVFSVGVVAACLAADKARSKKLLWMPIAMALLASSIYFHRSMIPVVVIGIVWILLPWKDRLSKYSIWLFPVLVIAISLLIGKAFEELAMIANSWNDDETGTLDKMEHYRTMESASSNLNGYITLIVKYSTFYLPFFLIANAFRSDRVLQVVDKRGVWLYQIVYLIFVFATSFLFLDFDSTVLFYRYLFVSFIPLSMLIVYMKNVGAFRRNQYYWIVACFVINTLLQLSGAVYSQL